MDQNRLLAISFLRKVVLWNTLLHTFTFVANKVTDCAHNKQMHYHVSTTYSHPRLKKGNIARRNLAANSTGDSDEQDREDKASSAFFDNGSND